MNKDHLADRVEKIRKFVADSEFRIPGDRIKMTISGGFSVWENDGETTEELLKRIDMALYLAKNKYGRNHVKEGLKK